MDDKSIAFQSLVAAQNAADWAFWAMIGTWFSGAATLSAVVLSLYLANRKSKPHVRASASWTGFDSGFGVVQGLGITVANLGEVRFIISSIQWDIGGGKRLVQFFDQTAITQQLPKPLEGGESALFFIKSEGPNAWANIMKQDIENNGGKVRKLRLNICLASGAVIKFKVNNIVKTLSNLD